jgi:hypothetical protein
VGALVHRGPLRHPVQRLGALGVRRLVLTRIAHDPNLAPVTDDSVTGATCRWRQADGGRVMLSTSRAWSSCSSVSWPLTT